jgi:thiol-disulfide isomerase/thioredoxin
MSFFSNSKHVKELESKDFEGIATWKLKSKKCSIVLFYMGWCPHCKDVKGIWEGLAKKALFMDVLAFDCEANDQHLNKIREDMPEMVRGYPTIIFYVNGEPKETFSGDRTEANLLKACMRVCQGRNE